MCVLHPASPVCYTLHTAPVDEIHVCTSRQTHGTGMAMQLFETAQRKEGEGDRGEGQRRGGGQRTKEGGGGSYSDS